MRSTSFEMSPTRKPLRFVDLFAGLGGFHVGLSSLGHRCVFACESDESLQAAYLRNFGVLPSGDITQIEASKIPEHDILCAGFPCQPFSKAGHQTGFNCPKNGSLFDHVLRVVKVHRPEFVLLENVPHLRKHDSGKTWQFVYDGLRRLGYETDANIMSPHEFGVPQIRQRIFIVARLGSLGDFSWPKGRQASANTVFSVLDSNPQLAKPISKQLTTCIEVWQEFLDRIPADATLPSWPIWAMEFGATYPFEQETPFGVGKKRLRKFLGSFGNPLTSDCLEDPFVGLPSHARTEQIQFPRWKVNFIRENRRFYEQHKRRLRGWLSQVQEFPSSLQKLEWNCQGEKRDIWSFIIQIRASGVRLKRPITVPSLVAMTTTQVPIVGWEKRYMTVKECARLQSLQSLRHWPESDDRAYKALGNAVNAKLISILAEALIGKARKKQALRSTRRVSKHAKHQLAHV